VPTPRKTLLAVAAACALAVTGCGADSSDTGNITAPPPPGNAADRGFVNAMLPLHEKAVAIGVIGQKQGGGYVKDLSLKISESQAQETARLRSIGSALFSAGVPVGPSGVPKTTAASVSLKTLRESKDFDQAFFRAMIPIHEATIALARAEIKRGDQVDLKTTSQQIIDVESAQLAAMRKRLKA